VLNRPLDMPKPQADWIQCPVPTNHQGAFLDISSGKRGLALINKGLPEYEACKSKNGNRIYLTLLRCVGRQSRYNALFQPIDLENFATPEAQCPGTHTFLYSLIPHKGNWESAQIHRMAYEHNVPVRAIYCNNHNLAEVDSQALPHTQSFISVEPANLLVSALKKCEFGNGIILRFYNPTEKVVDGIIKTYEIAMSAKLTNLNEEPLSEGNLEIDGEGVIHIKVGGHEIKTIELHF
jgi:mannosylglycerate hydrolase